MKNRLMITALLAAFLLLFGSVTLVTTHRVCGHMHRLVAEAQILDPAAESAALAHQLDRIETDWERYRRTLSVYSRHDEVERVSQEIEQLRPLLDNGQHTQLALTLTAADNALQHLWETEVPSFDNIL